ncbi:MAG TPA: dTMP kinase [Spirochaetia bacterium]|nr:dTMP kinase [Spirochaetia bacterium]
MLEGLDGAGTSTQLRMLDRKLDAEGVRHAATWEPTDGPVGLLLRSILAREVGLHPATTAMLYAADRNQHVNDPDTGIVALASQGVLVVSDRYVFSSLAYQSIQCGFEYVLGLNAGFPLPQLLIFLDTPVEVSQARLASRTKVELFDGVSFQTRVRDAYLQAFDRFRSTGMRICVVDGNRPADEIHREIWNLTSALPITRM